MKPLFLALLLIASGTALADTQVSGTISTNTTWTLSGSPYILTGDVYVGGASAPTLTIDAGVVIKGNTHAQLLVNVSAAGAIQANGTAASPILFTANGTATQGYWWGLRIGSTTGAPASSLTYTTIEYAGSTSYSIAGVMLLGTSPTLDHVISRNHLYAGFRIDGGAPVLTSCESRSNSSYGIYINAGSTTLTNLTVAGNGGKAISAPPDADLLDMSGMSATTNGANAIELRGGTIAANHTWHACAVPYLSGGVIKVEGPAAPVLTIEGGTTVKFIPSTNLVINSGASGGLIASGTASAPVLLTTSSATPAAGQWYGISFGATPNPPALSLAYTTVEYAGSTSYGFGGITIAGCSPSLDHVTARINQHAGIRIDQGAIPTLTACDIRQNSGYGINVISGGASISNTSFTSNTTVAVSGAADAQFTGMSGLTATGNGTNGIELRGGTIAANRTWKTCAVPYVVTNAVVVEGASTPVLTIEPGVTVRFNTGAQLTINNANLGGLAVNGTAASPVLFTANNTQSAGSWNSIYLGGFAGGPASTISYATIEYGGYSTYGLGGVTIIGGSHVLDHVTVRSNAYGGVVVNGGTPALRNSAFNSNSGPGVRVTAAATLALTNDSFTSNSTYPVSLPVNAALSDATGLTAASNTSGNGIAYGGGTLTASMTWPLSALPYIVTGVIAVEGPAAPVLTIAAGNTVRFTTTSQIVVNNANKGGLIAAGTAAAPILFTSNGTLQAGYWTGILLSDFAGGPASSIAWATIEYAGMTSYTRGGLTVYGGSPQLDHLTLRNNLVGGLVAGHTATPRITNSVFSSNPSGVYVIDSAQVLAPLNYWGSANGACTTGCAAGQQSYSGNAVVEPWLIAAPSSVQYLTAATQRNRAFSPAIAVQMKLDYAALLAGSATVTVRNSGNTAVRTFNTSGTNGSIAWDGTNDSGAAQPNGTYSYEIAATSATGSATIAHGVAIIDSTRVLSLNNPAFSWPFFSPNADNVQDTTAITSSTNYDDATWTISILDTSSNVVRTQTGSGMTVAFTWDGRDGSSTLQPDGTYTVRIDAAVGTATLQRSGTVTLDTTPPSVTIATPTSGYVVSNVYLNGGTTITPTGTVSDTNLKDWSLQQGAGASPTYWTKLNGGTTAVSNATLGSWPTAALANGSYAFRLDATDKAGNAISTPVVPVVVGHFAVSQSAYQFNGVGGQTVSYTSTVPFPLTETIAIRDASGATVRNLIVSSSRAAGSYTDSWNGLSDSNAVLPDAPYFYIATVTDGTHTFVLDHSTDYRNDFTTENDNLVFPAWDPFNNQPLKFTYTTDQPALVTIATSTLGSNVSGDCDVPNSTFFCPVYNVWMPSGVHRYSWAGVDYTGSFRELKGIGVRATSTGFPKNVVIMWGTAPIIDNVRVTPTVFGPGTGTPQTIEFDLQTYLSRPAAVTIGLRNLDSHTFLRTLTLPGTAAGHVTTTWDGRADNGMPVAPGFYQVLVTATDPIGNSTTGDILTTIQY